jgi:uncharacterized membrane protein
MKRLLGFAIAVLTLGMLVFFAAVPKAQAAERVIDSLSQQVVISQDGVANVVESIDYDFSNNSRHGIERYYELSSKNPEGKFYNLNFDLISITQDGKPAQFRDDQEGNLYYIRVGDPNVTVTGKHRYVITYKVWPVVRQDPAGDFINYDVTGNDWQVPILRASAVITLPTGVSATQTRCYTGVAGSTQQVCTVTSSGNTVQVVSGTSLSPGQGLTVNAIVPAGSFDEYLVASDKPLTPISNTVWFYVFGIAIGLGIILIGCLVRLIKYLGRRRAERNETIVAQYEAPDKMLPAEMGVLEDLKLGMPEITATIIDLAVKGYMKIRRVKDTNDFEFVILKHDTSGLQDYEKEMMDMFVSSAVTRANEKHKVLDISKLDKAQSSRIITGVYDKIDTRLRAKKYYSKKISGGTKAGGLVGVIVSISVLTFAFGMGTVFWLIIPIACIIIAVGIAKTPGNMTKAGYSQWAKVEGLKLFLTVTEKDRLKFHDAPSKNPQLFNKLLPAAIALQVENEWAKQFEGIDVSKATGWYSDYDPVTSVWMASVLSNSFNTSLASSFTPPSSTGSSSGGFSGGGFSGGGSFGGGGGGDW